MCICIALCFLASASRLVTNVGIWGIVYKLMQALVCAVWVRCACNYCLRPERAAHLFN